MAGVVLIAAVLLLVLNVSHAAPKAALSWKACPPNLSGDALECGYMSVPLDWNHPKDGEKVELGMVKLTAKDPANRIGNIFYNPGGPGDLASQVLAAVAKGSKTTRIQEELLEKFDIIGMDLRGTGLSNPIVCDSQLFNNPPDELYPGTDLALRKRQEFSLAFRGSCAKMTGPLIDHMDTVSIARDFEAVREALGEDSLSWVGTSYGTQLATQYAELFPDNIRAMVLDGCVSKSLSESASFALGAANTDVVLRYFFDWCEQQGPKGCPLNRGDQSVQNVWIDLMTRADREGIPALKCQHEGSACMKSILHANDMRNQVKTFLYDAFGQNLRGIANILAEAAFNNNASGLITTPITADDKPYESSSHYANVVIDCSDRVSNDTPAYGRFKQRFAESEAPLMNGISANSQSQLICLGWPEHECNMPRRIDIPMTPKMDHIFMTNNLYDPATPFAGAVNLQQELGERAILVTRNASGHSMFLKPDAYEGPTMAALVRYLVDGKVPEAGTLLPN